jgi:hypothetical protein
MPSVFVPVSTFPNVPFLPGVPQIARSALFQPATQVTLGAQAQSGLWAASQVIPSWGIFDANGNKVIFPDNIFAFSDRAEWRTSDYPVEDGGFGSYNKVIVPFEDSVRMTKGGSLSQRNAFLKSIDNISGDTLLYSIRTPEKTYLDVNVLRRELLRRSSEGAYFLEVDLFFRNIQEKTPQYSTAAANTSNAANPAALPTTNVGNVQTNSTVPNSLQNTVQGAIASAPL